MILLVLCHGVQCHRAPSCPAFSTSQWPQTCLTVLTRLPGLRLLDHPSGRGLGPESAGTVSPLGHRARGFAVTPSHSAIPASHCAGLSGCLWDILADHTRKSVDWWWWGGSITRPWWGTFPSQSISAFLGCSSRVTTEVLGEDTCSSTANRSLPSPLFPTPDCIAGGIWEFLGPV